MSAKAGPWRRGEFEIDADGARLDLALVHEFLAASYWAEGISRRLVRRSIAHSLCFGLYRGRRQIGFARVVSDRTTFAYLSDVFVLEEFRGQGLGHWLVATAMAHPELKGLRRWCLVTRTAQDFYRRHGFEQTARPERWMEIVDPEVYLRGSKK